MRTAVKIVMLALIVWWIPQAVYADILYLKSGHSLEGRVVQETEDGVIFDVGGGEVNFSRSEIDRIEKGNVAAAQDKTVEHFSPAKKPAVSLADRWKNWTSGFSKDAKKKRESPASRPAAGKKDETMDVKSYILLVLAGGLLQYVVAAFTMKVYLSITGHFVSYLEMLWFQLKLLLIGFVVVFVMDFGFLFLMGIITHGQFQPNIWVSILLGVLPFTITYYVLAKKDLDAGFLEALPLSIVIGVTYIVVEKALEKFGIIFPTSYLQQMQSLNPFGGPGT